MSQKRSVDVAWNGLYVEAIVTSSGLRGETPDIEVVAVSIDDALDHADLDDARDLPDDLYRQLWEAAADDEPNHDY